MTASINLNAFFPVNNLFSNIFIKLKEKEIKRVFENFISLSVLQGAKYILPLVTLPYLVRVLGPEKFGLVMFAQAFVQYFVIFTDYGFNFSATRDISLNRENKDKQSEIFISVIVIKLIIFFLCSCVLVFLVSFFSKFSSDADLYYLTFGIVFGYVLFPSWFFQGIEDMRYLTILDLLSKLIFTISIFVFVKETSDYIYVPLINSIGYVFSGLFGIILVFKKYKLDLIKPSINQIISQLKGGGHIFISSVATNSYLLSNTFFLGLFAGNTAVGFYSASEKIVRTLTYLLLPIFQALFPYITRKAGESAEKIINLLKQLTLYIILFCSIGYILLYILSDGVILLILGSKFNDSIIIFKILLPLIVIIPVSYILFNLVMLPFKMDKYYSRIYIFGSFFNLSLIIILLGFIKTGAAGVAYANVVNEALLVIIAILILRQKRIKFFFECLSDKNL